MKCDRIARSYRSLEYLGFGRELERRRFRYLPQIAGARRILALGEGDGRFLARLVQQNPQATIDYADASARMLELARGRAGEHRVRYCLDSALTIPLARGEYDLVVTHFFLDCFDERDACTLVARVAAAARPGAQWLISEFRQPGRGWRAAWAWLWLRALYLFFGVTTGLRTRRLVDHRPILAGQGFRLEREETSRFGLLASELWVRD